MENKFLKTNFDKFKNITTTETSYPYIVEDREKSSTTIGIYHVSAPSGSLLMLKVIHVKPYSWFHLNHGKMIFNINNVENIILEPKQVGAECLYNYKSMIASYVQHIDACDDDGEQRRYYIEEDNYIITQEELKKICDATSVDIQISGEAQRIEVNANNFIAYCRLFYNAFYDNEAYVDTVEKENKRIAKAKSKKKAIGCMWSMVIAFICVLIYYFIFG